MTTDKQDTLLSNADLNLLYDVSRSIHSIHNLDKMLKNILLKIKTVFRVEGASIALHERLGFEHVGVLPATGFKHGQWLDSVLMQLAMGDGGTTDPDPDTYPGTLYVPKG